MDQFESKQKVPSTRASGRGLLLTFKLIHPSKAEVVGCTSPDPISRPVVRAGLGLGSSLSLRRADVVFRNEAHHHAPTTADHEPHR